ncbi:MAG: energy transducer TonB [Pseudomonadales bacterium]|nr:energy transducer TonB [Pseudomonadales bacterium]
MAHTLDFKTQGMRVGSGWNIQGLCLVLALLLHAGLLLQWRQLRLVSTAVTPEQVMDIYAVAVAPSQPASTAGSAASAVTEKAPVAEPNPVESKPVEPKSVEPRAVEPKSIESSAFKSQRVEFKRVQSKPVEESRPVESRSAESKPVESSPAPVTPAPSTRAASSPVLVKKPQFLAPPVQPEYPALARRRGQQGTVLLEILLSETGQQLQRTVVRSSGFAVLDEAAQLAAAQWRLAPYRLNGVTVTSRVHVPVEFNLQ